MSSFCENEVHLRRFCRVFDGVEERLALQVYEWKEGQEAGESFSLPSVGSLIKRENSTTRPTLRVVFAPINCETPSEENAFNLLFRHYSVPSGSILERMLSVTHSFGTRKFPERNVEIAWTHFLSKDLQIRRNSGYQRPEKKWDSTPHDVIKQNNEDFTWVKADFFLHTRRVDQKTSASCVTLFCFGDLRELEARFQRLLEHQSWQDTLREPYLLMEIVYSELYHYVDLAAWRLADVFRSVERGTLSNTKTNNNNIPEVDFQGLHHLAKHALFMSEAMEAAILTVEGMSSHLRRNADQRMSPELALAAVDALNYRVNSFQSTRLRLKSLEKRMANIISLSFNLVTQQDSQILTNDSRAMKSIAAMTLVFLPATAIASIFSSPFFHVNFDTDPETTVQVARSFWVFWAITLPLTVAIVISWWGWYKAVARVRGVRRKHNESDSKAQPKEKV